MADPCAELDLQAPVDVSAAIDQRDVDLVQKTWTRAAGLGAETVGKVLLMQILSIAPEAIGLFPFKEYPQDRLYKVGSPLIEYGANIVNTLNVAIGMLNDLPALVPVLKTALPGLFPGAQKEHYGVVGQAALNSLEIALGRYWTDPVRNAWLKIWTTVVAVMFPEEKEEEKANEQEQEKRRLEELDQKKQEDEVAKKKKAAEAKAKAAAAKKKAEAEAKSKFFEAAENGDKETFVKLLKTVKPDIVNDEGMNSLMLAAANGHAEIVKVVLATGKLNVNATRPQGKVPALAFAAKANHTECAVLITKAGADVRAKGFGKLPCDLAEDKQLKLWFTWCMRTGRVGEEFESAVKMEKQQYD